MENRDENESESYPRYTLRQVVGALVVFYGLLALLDAKGLHGWASKLPVSERNVRLKELTEAHWDWTAAHGLEEPKHTLETEWMKFEEAHPLLYPKKRAEVVARRRAKEEKAREGKAKSKAETLAAGPVTAKAVKGEKSPLGSKKLAAKSAPISNAKPPATGKQPNILIIGDSIMVNIGPVIKKDVVEKLNGAAEVKARVATGLARPDVFDWRLELERSIERDSYDAIVLMLGTNDSQDFTVGGEILSYGTTAWVKAYNERIAGMMDLACRGARRAVWLGLPPMQSAAFNRKAVRINSWAKRQAEKHPCVSYVGLESVLGDERGRYAGYLKIGETLEKVRMVDGIHITQKGGKVVAELVVEMLERDGLASR